MKDLATTNHFDPLLEGEREELLPAKENNSRHVQRRHATLTLKGQERRALNEQQERQMYPQGILEDMKSSSTDYHNRWADNSSSHTKTIVYEVLTLVTTKACSPSLSKYAHRGEKRQRSSEAYELMSDCYGKMIEPW